VSPDDVDGAFNVRRFLRRSEVVLAAARAGARARTRSSPQFAAKAADVVGLYIVSAKECLRPVHR
jgi:hypothetical protein